MPSESGRDRDKATSREIDEFERIKRRSLHAERRVHEECAAMVHTARLEAGLTQVELGRLVGTSQSAIARFEDPTHGVRTLAMMARIACALGYEYTEAFVKLEPKFSGHAVIMAPPNGNGTRGEPD